MIVLPLVQRWPFAVFRKDELTEEKKHMAAMWVSGFGNLETSLGKMGREKMLFSFFRDISEAIVKGKR